MIYHPASFYKDIFPKFPPDNWEILQKFGDGWALRGKQGLRVIIDVREVESEFWLHVSYSRKSRLPDWKDTKLVKELFIGDYTAIIVLPPQEDYVNLHEYCMHLWYCITKNIIPNFTGNIGGIKSI